jgi:hypothetical protein
MASNSEPYFQGKFNAMSGNFGSPNPIQPLNVGDVVSAGMRLYTSHLKEYYLIALQAYLWVIVPFYGWAKFYALSALISRLAFGDLVNQPESVVSGKRFVNSRLWQFFLTLVLILLIGIGIYIGLAIVFIVAAILLGVLFGGLNMRSPATLALLIPIVFVGIIMTLIALSWLFTRLYLVDMPLAIEENVNSTSSISRSWELTQGNVWRILLISTIGFLITLPVQFAIQIILSIFQLIALTVIPQNSGFFYVLYYIVSIIVVFASGALVIPFWQTTKAVVYYDMRSRQEGLGLKLRDHDI